jgi:TP901-1 family phage major tail protein
MTAQRGRDLLLKIDDGAGFVTVAGLRANRIAFNAETVDITDSQSAGHWRELLEGAGLRRAAVAGEGIFRDAASDALVRESFFGGVIPVWQIVLPDFGQIGGPFQIVALTYSGRHTGELAFSLALESAGQISFTAL